MTDFTPIISEYVSTHSRAEAAAGKITRYSYYPAVSTHSRAEAAATFTATAFLT